MVIACWVGACSRGKPEFSEKDANALSVLEAMDTVILSVDFEEAPIEEVIEFVRQKTVRHADGESPPVSGIVRVEAAPSVAPEERRVHYRVAKGFEIPKITFAAEDVSLGKLFAEMGRQTGFEVHVTGEGLVFRHPEQPLFPAGEGRILRTLFEVAK